MYCFLNFYIRQSKQLNTSLIAGFNDEMGVFK